MSDNSIGYWENFFINCGLPLPSALSYAHIFVENRMKVDMITDLNKDYLREMGITLMGDIISILRHAKTVNIYQKGHLLDNSLSRVGGTKHGAPSDTLIPNSEEKYFLPNLDRSQLDDSIPSLSTNPTKANKVQPWKNDNNFSSVQLEAPQQKPTSSIFSRLGSKIEKNEIKSILKKAPKDLPVKSKSVSVQPPKQIVPLKRLSTKVNTNAETFTGRARTVSQIDYKSTNFKAVTFASTAEVREIQPNSTKLNVERSPEENSYSTFSSGSSSHKKYNLKAPKITFSNRKNGVNNPLPLNHKSHWDTQLTLKDRLGNGNANKEAISNNSLTGRLRNESKLRQCQKSNDLRFNSVFDRLDLKI